MRQQHQTHTCVQVQLWDYERGVRVSECSGHLKEVVSLQLSPSTVVSGSSDTTVKLWDRSTCDCTVTLRGHTGTVMSVHYDSESAPHRVVSGSYDKTTKVCVHACVRVTVAAGVVW